MVDDSSIRYNRGSGNTPPMQYKTDWSILRVLNRKMNWGDPEQMDALFIYALDSWCEAENVVPFVTPEGGTIGKHAPGSLHFSGRACDFMVPASNFNSLFDLFISLSRYPFSEIGIYPDWVYNKQRHGGFHVGLDNRIQQRKKLWLGVKVNGENQYLGITKANLKHYGVT